MKNSFKKKIVIKCKSFDSVLLDGYILSVLSVVNENNGYIIGPVPLPITSENLVINQSKNISRDHSQTRNREPHVRLLYVFDESEEVNLDEKINKIAIPGSIGVEIKSNEVSE